LDVELPVAAHEKRAARLLEELNYMNLEEIRGFRSERGIPYRIVAEHSNGKVKATKDTDRKPIVLALSGAISKQAKPVSRAVSANILHFPARVVVPTDLRSANASHVFDELSGAANG
jgi:hypothetical protein